MVQDFERVKGLEIELTHPREIRAAFPVLEALQSLSLRGVGFPFAVMAIAELGDLTLFEKPRQLMVFFGLHRSDRHAPTGERWRLGGITKTGNMHAHCALALGTWA